MTSDHNTVRVSSKWKKYFWNVSPPIPDPEGGSSAVPSEPKPTSLERHDRAKLDLATFSKVENVIIEQFSATQNVYQGERKKTDDETSGTGDFIHKPFANGHSVTSGFYERSDYEIYSQYLFLRRRGIPLWEPRPEKTLPIEYRRNGVELGDVGIVDPITGRFKFLFNLFLPAGHEINRGRVPDGFTHLDKSKVESDIDKDDILRHCFASSSVRESRSPDFEFRTTGREGALLVVPDGGLSEDLSDDSVLKEYIITHAKAWWGQIRGNTEYGVYVIVGMDKVPRWGMATFQNVDEPLEFELAVKEESRIWPSCVWKGIHSSKAGPGEMDRHLTGSDMLSPSNQCVFIRTLNFLVSSKLPEELTVQVACPNCSNQPLDDSSQDPTKREPKVHIKSWREGLSTSSPARLLNQYLLKHCPNAEVVITKDADWMSVITETDDMPSPEDILARVLRSHKICQNEGVVTLEKINTMTPDSNLTTITHQDVLPTNENEVRCYCTFDDQGVTKLGGDVDNGMDIDLCDVSVSNGGSIFQGDVTGSSATVTKEHATAGKSIHPLIRVDEMRSIERSKSAGINLSDAQTLESGSRHVGQSSTYLHLGRIIPRMDQSKEQTEAIQRTCIKVARAVISVLAPGSDTIHEALFIDVDLRQFAPVPALYEAARTLLDIWNVVPQLDIHRLACLRLTERCADILLSVCHEIHDSGSVVGEESLAAIANLEKSYLSVRRFMIHQHRRSWLKRYLKRSKTLSEISECDRLLQDALSSFNVSNQMRTLKLVQESEKRRQTEFQALAASILHDLDRKSVIDSETALASAESDAADLLGSTIEYSTRNALDPICDGDPTLPTAAIPASRVISAIQLIQDAQNAFDASLNRRRIVPTDPPGSDMGIHDVLQVKREESQDAILDEVVRKLSVKNPDVSIAPKFTSTINKLERSSSEDSGSRSSSEIKSQDPLDREFLETGIDALRRMDHDVATTVPRWMVTKYEVDLDEKIGVGFFSEVYKGTWRGYSVAIKILAETTPRTLFIREIAIWKTLRHSNVLQLYGVTGDAPFFIVSPYMKNGNLVEYLRRIEAEIHLPGLGVESESLATNPSRGLDSLHRVGFDVLSISRSPSGENKHVQRKWDLFCLMHEIADGMSYLHSKGVLHGDLKAANVLVDDEFRCVVSDFGQCEMRSEAYRIAGTSPSGSLRWQSPERMSGKTQLTIADDVWAFSISCVEILNMGRMPWSLMDDNTVRYHVLKDAENSRPSIPQKSNFNTPRLQDILRSCWSTNPEQRPKFPKVSRSFKLLRKSFGQNFFYSPASTTIEDVPEVVHPPSPDLRQQGKIVQNRASPIPDEVFDGSLVPAITSSEKSHHESRVVICEDDVFQPAIFTPVESQTLSRKSPVPFHLEEEEDPITVTKLDYESPPPDEERIALIRNERLYRRLLTHDYDPSLTLPLWTPTDISLGAVGYLSKPKGEFITLFSAYSPDKASHPLIQKLPSIEGYGHVGRLELRQGRRTVTQKALDLLGDSLSSSGASEQVSRRYSFPLKAGQQAAYLCTEITQYEYMEFLDAPRKWFQVHVDEVMEAYGSDHHIQEEDLILVTGALRVPDYGLFVSHSHPDGHVHFSVYASQRVGQPWGTFTTEADITPWDEDLSRVSASKISRHGDLWTTVLLARLHFKHDAVVTPTSK